MKSGMTKIKDNLINIDIQAIFSTELIKELLSSEEYKLISNYLELYDLKFKNFDISSMLSELVIKMHRYDEIAKGITIERNILMNKLKEAEEKLKTFEGVSSESKDSESVEEKEDKNSD